MKADVHWYTVNTGILQAIGKGYIDGNHIAIDATHVEARGVIRLHFR
ncbi:hypothetical protein HMPREF0083_05809 [Aneurinibacillus aneurinilyticus ATCC 12856]|uniref:Uncharacterized protein n=1 Tax=Aneurinibacillus aneurinilyticus ATCC 12856 TaxID=649747 RepID=U1WS06_ANEAE|nr:hypothetical protein HMPREF0083_05809 [Aneurinibacillus aneurinilyticus ATCC 12856]